NFNRDDVDACIHSDTQALPDAQCRRLFGELLLPVCSPALLDRGLPMRVPDDLGRHVLVCSLHRPRDWPTWLGAAGVTAFDGNSGIKLENSALACQAAIDGLGVVIAQRSFVEDDLRAGRLVAPFDLEVPGDGAYFLAYPIERPKGDGVAAFETWLLREAAVTDQQLARHAPEGLGPAL
ncbi:MAG: LysR substrate-binding domain-containing protein, partial [Casimicrobiaceae bacterium]